ncbi:MAG: hypothetical protein R3A10_05810 [Caldilineaceae bacterium]
MSTRCCAIFRQARFLCGFTFLDAFYPLTDGNPFLIEEALKSLVMAGRSLRRRQCLVRHVRQALEILAAFVMPFSGARPNSPHGRARC